MISWPNTSLTLTQSRQMTFSANVFLKMSLSSLPPPNPPNKVVVL